MLVSVLIAWALPSQAQPYAGIDLGTLGGDGSTALAVNNADQVVGYAQTSGPDGLSHAFLWDAQHGMQDLGTLGGDISWARGINDAGQVVGLSYLVGNTHVHAFIWDAQHGMQDLGTLGGDFGDATAINGLGQVVGSSLTASGEVHAFFWDAATGMQDLGTLGGTRSEAYGVNELGQVVGVSYRAGDLLNRAFLVDPGGSMVDLGTLGGDHSEAAAINAQGQIAGTAVRADRSSHAFRWSAVDGMQDLDALSDIGGGVARGINASGQIAGAGLAGAGETHAFLFTPGAPPLDLGTLGSHFSYAYAVNDAGHVVGAAGFHAALWRPFSGNTPSGTDVPVTVNAAVGLVFASVSNPGDTSVTTSASGPELTHGFLANGIYYDIATTASFGGPIQVCIRYDDAGLSIEQEQTQELLHYELGAWAVVTTSRDTTNNVICGASSALSPFVVALHMTALEALFDLQSKLAQMNLPAARKRVLAVELGRAQTFIQQGRAARACVPIGVFVATTTALRGHGVSAADAAVLLEGGQAVQALLGCSH